MRAATVSVAGSANGVPELERAARPGGQLARLGRPDQTAGEIRGEVVEESEVPDLFRLHDGEPRGDLLNLRLADHRLDGGDIGRVEREEKDVAVGLRGEEFG